MIVPVYSKRELLLADLRVQWAIRRHQEIQLSRAIEVLADKKTKEDLAIRIAGKILGTNIEL